MVLAWGNPWFPQEPPPHLEKKGVRGGNMISPTI